MARRQSSAPKRPAQAAAGGRSLTPFYIVLGLVAAAGIGFLLYQTTRGGSGSASLEPVAVELDPAELAQVQGVAIGPEDAPVVIYEFADFQCPGCAQYSAFVMPLVKERLVDAGLVRYVYYDFPLVSIHPHAFLAARAARCADDQGRFWEYHDLLYGRQPRWSGERSAPVATFADYAAELGLDRGAFEECLRSDRHAEAVTRNLRLGESLGVQGTPTLFVNGKRLPGIPSYQDLERIIQDEAGGAGAQPAAGVPAAGVPADTAPAATAPADTGAAAAPTDG